MLRLLLYTLLIFSITSCSLNHRHQLNVPAGEINVHPPINEILGSSITELKTKTAVWSLENGGKSLTTRLWLIEHAKKSIQLQYFSFATDKTGVIVCDQLIRAADRGVKVRILIDDAAGRMNRREISLLDSHENIEIRVYNASALLASPHGKIMTRIRNSNHILRRMHNKTFTVDDQVGITGGRNIADEYFDFHKKYNFRDRDVLLFGKAVDQIMISFEQFWNDTVTVSSVGTKIKSKKERTRDASRFDDIHRDAAKIFSTSLKEKVNAFPAEFNAAENAGELVWAGPVSFVSDGPVENRTEDGSTCTDSLIALIRKAKVSVDIHTPYFIVTDRGKDLLKEAIKNGIKVRVLTNSLASIDNIEAFSAYQKDRKELLEAGVIIYEFKPHPEVRFKMMIPEVQEPIGYKAIYGFHSKSIIIDGKVAVIGSYNFDPRSADYNTECIAIFHSADVARSLFKYMEAEFQPQNSWLVTKDKYPDSKAGFKKQLQAFLNRVYPKKVL